MDNYFEQEKTDSIIMPFVAAGLRNDCSANEGNFYAGSKKVGNVLNCSIFTAKRLKGKLGQTGATNWLQIWFVAEAGSSEKIPRRKLQVTYIKNESLENYENNLDRVRKGIEKGTFKNYAHPVYIATFTPKHGIAAYFVIDWDIRERTEADTSLIELADFYKKNHKNFVDSRARTLTPVQD